MRNFLILFLLAIPISTGLAKDDFLGTRMSHFKESIYSFDLTRSALSKAPRWVPSAKSPPLSPRRAQKIAFALVKRLRPEVSEWRLDRITLEPIQGTDWIYLVTY